MPCDMFENKCRLCGGTAKRKNYYFIVILSFGPGGARFSVSSLVTHI